MCFHLSWLSSFERLAYINNHHCFIYLVKAVYCGVPNKPIKCLFDFEQSFLSSTAVHCSLFLAIYIGIINFSYKEAHSILFSKTLPPICSGLEQNFYWFKRNFPTKSWKYKSKLRSAHACNIRATCWQNVGNNATNMLVTLQQYTGNMLATCWQHIATC